MTRINLLPWRDERRVARQRQFMAMLAGAVVIAGLGVAAAHLYAATLIEHQEARNQYLRQEITRLKRVEKEIQEMERSEDRLRARLSAIQELQRSRPDMVQALDELVRQVPESIFLNSVRTSGKRFTLKGNASINNVVSDFMRDLEQSDIFGEPVLRIINNKEVVQDVVASEFELIVDRKKSQPASSENE